MSFRVSIETSIGETLRVLHANGQVGGNALFSFIVPIANHCAGDSELAIQQWINSIQPFTKRSFCELLQSIIGSNYSGDWKYTENEFALFQSQNPQYQITESGFKQVLHDIETKWTFTNIIVSDVAEILHLFAQANPPSTWWYDSHWTILDLEALYQTLLLAANRRAERVRLQFS